MLPRSCSAADGLAADAFAEFEIGMSGRSQGYARHQLRSHHSKSKACLDGRSIHCRATLDRPVGVDEDSWLHVEHETSNDQPGPAHLMAIISLLPLNS